jgi:hypothetical protein
MRGENTITQQEVLGRTSRVLSFDMTKENEDGHTDAQTEK